MRGNVVIVGGGIGGLALALALRRAGAPAVVCERAPELREVGAGLLLTPNASWVLHRLGLLDAACAHGRTVRSWRILDRRGRELQRFNVGAERAPSLSVARSALQGLLREHLEAGDLRLGREAVALTRSEDADGEGTVHFADGEALRGALIIGADGGRSVVRGAVAGNLHPPRYRGYVGWRALVGAVPWSGGWVTESWAGGLRFGIAPVDERRTYWYASENAPPGLDVPPGERKARLRRLFAGWHAPIPELIEATDEAEILLNEIADHAPLPRWHRGNVAVLGDAAHLMTPNLGQGAATALEDAWTLARCVAELGPRPAALARYERLRRRRTAWMAWQSRQIGWVIQLENPVLGSLRDAALRLAPDWLGTRALAPVFNFRV